MPLVPALGRQRQGDLRVQGQDSQGYSKKPYLKTKQNNPKDPLKGRHRRPEKWVAQFFSVTEHLPGLRRVPSPDLPICLFVGAEDEALSLERAKPVLCD